MKAKNPCAITHHHEVSDEVLQENVMLRYTRDGNDLHVPRPLMTTVERLLETVDGTLVNSIVCLTRYLMPPATIILSLFHSSIPSINTFIYQLSIRHGRAMGTDFQGLRREDLYYFAIDSECERR